MNNATGVYDKTCLNVIVHVTENTIGSVISDTVACFLDLFMAVISICSNALVIRVYLTTSSVKTSANLLLVSLSTLEILKSLFVQPAFFVWKTMELARRDFCYFYIFTILGNNFCTVSSFVHTCFLITIERYLSVFRPILHRKPIVKRMFKFAVITTQLVCAVILLATFFASQHRVYFMFASILIITCLIATAVVYIMIRARMRSTPVSGAAVNVRSASKQAADRRMNNTVISIILISLACYLPLFFVLTFISVHERTVFHTRYVIPWTYVITYFTAALNPFVYCWKNRRLRNEMLKFTSRVLKTKTKTTEKISTASTAPTSQTTKV